MAKIKNKISGRNIKIIDRTSYVNYRMKEVFFKTKDQVQNQSDDGQVSAPEYAEDKIKYMTEDVAGGTGRVVIKGTRTTVKKGRELYKKHKEKQMKNYITDNPDTQPQTEEKLQKKALNKKNKNQTSAEAKSTIKTRDKAKEGIKQSGESTGKQTIKITKKSVKSSQKVVKTTEKTTKATIKTAEKTAKASKEAVKATAKAAQRTAQAAKVVAKAVIMAVRSIIAGAKVSVAAIAAGGWVAVVIILIVCIIGLMVGSVFGIFFSSEDTGTQTMLSVVHEITADYEAKIQDNKNRYAYDVLEMSGAQAEWKEVLAVYSVMVNTDVDDPKEVASIDDGKKATLKKIFWEMNVISCKAESKTETVVTETDDGNGNITTTEEEKTRTFLYIIVSHKSADEMAKKYGFSDDQKEQLYELLSDEYDELWLSIKKLQPQDSEPDCTGIVEKIDNGVDVGYYEIFGYRTLIY